MIKSILKKTAIMALVILGCTSNSNAGGDEKEIEINFTLKCVKPENISSTWLKKLLSQLKDAKDGQITIENQTIKDEDIGSLLAKVYVELKHPFMPIFKKCTFEQGALEFLCKQLESNIFQFPSLTISDTPIGDQKLQCLADALKANKTLTTLTLVNIDMSEEGFNSIVKALKENKTLKELNLPSNQIEIYHDALDLDAWRANSTLKKLNLADQKPLLVINYVYPILTKDKALTELNLCNGQLNMPSLGEFKKETNFNNTTLTKLDLSHFIMNEIANGERELMSSIFKTNPKLQYLNLWGVKFKNFDIPLEISQALYQHQALSSLNLSYCDFAQRDKEKETNEVAMEEISEALKKNSTLKSLNLSCINIKRNGIKAICESLKANKTLKEFDFQGIPLNKQDTDYFIEALKENSTLEQLVLTWEWKSHSNASYMEIERKLQKNRKHREELEIQIEIEKAFPGFDQFSGQAEQNNHLIPQTDVNFSFQNEPKN